MAVLDGLEGITVTIVSAGEVLKEFKNKDEELAIEPEDDANTRWLKKHTVSHYVQAEDRAT